jgi:plastocyanin
MKRWPAILLTLAIVLVTLASAGAQQGVPAEIEPYRAWTKMNGAPLTDPSNPRAGPKNTFINLSPAQLREIIGPGARDRKPYPDGTIIVRESLDVDTGFVRVLFVQKKDSNAARTKGWVFSGFSRSRADEPFQPLAVPDPVARCLNCHEQMRASDLVFTPWLNRADALPARSAASGDRVEVFNYQFGPQAIRVKAGATVTFVNYDSVVHDVKAANRSFESGNIPLQGRYFLTLDQPGAYDYFCAIHLEMRGRITVEP